MYTKTNLQEKSNLMKKLLFLLLITSNYSFAQTITDVATGEYSTQYVKADGTVWVTSMIAYDAVYAPRQVAGLSGIVEADGGQYNSVFRKSDGTAYSAMGSAVNSTAYPTDYNGNAFTCDKLYAMWRMMVAIKDGEVWYWSANNQIPEDMLKQFGPLATPVPAPRKLIQPGGKVIVKCVHGSSISPYSSAILWGLASDGTLWQWDQTHTTPFQVTGKPGFAKTWTGAVKDIAINSAVNMVVTTTNEVWCWGYNAADYGGHAAWANADMDNIAPGMTGAGMTFPLKELAANYVCIQAIDASNTRFGIGNNQTGSLGSGYMAPSWRTNWNGAINAIYSYDYITYNGNQGTWLKLPGKWKNVKTNTSFAFYSYGQDMAGNWYSWGRAKSQGLGNGFTWKGVDQSAYPDWRDIPAPRLVNPLTATWTVDGAVNPAMVRSPIANAGINEYLSAGVTATTLYGSGSHQDQPTNTTTVTMTNAWTTISGPNAPAITSPTSQNTTVTGLISGTYVFRNTVTNSLGVTDYQEVSIVIGGSTVTNLPPVANAGADIVITLPISTTTLTGSATDAKGKVKSYSWIKISGPASGIISTPLSQTTILTGLSQGIYQYQLTATDDKDETDSDIIQVTVNPLLGTPTPPIVLLPAVTTSALVNGLDYNYYEGIWNVLPDFTKLNTVKIGVTPNFDISQANRAINYGFNFSGFINIPVDGQYTFYTTSDDGSNLYIDNVLVVANDGLHAPVEKSGIIGLKAGNHYITGLFFQQGGGTVFKVSYKSTAIAKQIVPASILYRNNFLPASNPTNIINGLDYKYYEGTWAALPQFSLLTPIKGGSTSNFDLSVGNRATENGFSFTGYIDVPSDAIYTFYTNSDDGSSLYIDNVLTVSNDGLHSLAEKAGTIGLKAGKHTIIGLFFQLYGNQVFQVSWQSATITKQIIPTTSLYRVNTATSKTLTNLSNTSLAAKLPAIPTDISLLKIVVYPNPAVTDFSLSVQGGTFEKINISVIGADGKIVYKANGVSNNTYKFGNDFAPGLYIVKVAQGNNEITQKVIKAQ